MVKYLTIWRAVSIRIKNNEMKLQEYEGTGMREENVRLINLLASVAAVTKSLLFNLTTWIEITI